MKFVFDTETTGLVAWHLPANDPCQPRLVQLGGVLVDECWNEISVVSVMVRPENFLIPSEASKIHGVTTERATNLGIHIKTALALFSNLARVAAELWAFNAQYDKTVIAGELARVMSPHQKSVMEQKGVKCAMLAAKDILKLPQPLNDRRIYPGRKDGDYKYPRLAEAHQFFCGCGFDRAHDALADVRATVRVMQGIEKWQREQPAPRDTSPMRPNYRGD